MFNCLADWIRLVWNRDSQDVAETSYSRLGTYPLGSVDAVTSVDSLFGFHLLPTYAYLAARFLDLGYTKEADLFGIPFDWRFGLHLNSSFWENVTKLIEAAVLSNGAKAVLIGHSMGSKFIHHFLTNLTTAEWRAKFIESTVLIAPSLGGSGAQYLALWTKEFAGMGYLGTFPDTVNGMGGIHIHMFNADIFENVTVFIDEKGKVFKGRDIVSAVKDNGMVPGDYEKIFDLYIPFFATVPRALDVPVAIVYNSRLNTPITIDRSSGSDVFVYGRGDTHVNAEGPEYFCSQWRGPTPVDCFDLMSDGFESSHITMLWNSDVLDFVVEHAVNETWTKHL
jgi:lecithin-cholesterol acyltransferase